MILQLSNLATVLHHQHKDNHIVLRLCTLQCHHSRSLLNLSLRMSESSDAEPDSPASKKQESSDVDEVLLNALDFCTAPGKMPEPILSTMFLHPFRKRFGWASTSTLLICWKLNWFQKIIRLMKSLSQITTLTS